MVNTEGQLYTMEGIAAGVIMILTAYLVLGSTSVYTPGDTHITDMQLEQVGADILKIMDAPENFTASENRDSVSPLEEIVATNDGARFHRLFWETYLMSGEIAAQKTTRTGSSVITNATVYYHYTDTSDPLNPIPVVAGYQLSKPLIPYSGSEPGVRVTRLVKIPGQNTTVCSSCTQPPCAQMPATVRDEPQVVLVEVFMWKA